MSAFRKQPVTGPVFLLPSHLDGDEQGDTAVHGGPEQAALCYAAAHYESWRRELGVDFGPGGFGENFTVAGADEESVCLGDVYQVGDAIVRVTKPRGPCFKIGLRWQLPATRSPRWPAGRPASAWPRSWARGPRRPTCSTPRPSERPWPEPRRRS